MSEARTGRKSPAQYASIGREIVRDIYAGRYPVGSLLPTEISLASHYRVSRQTVREALRVVMDMGLIVRQPGVGTTVVADAPSTTFLQSVRSVSELQQYAETTTLRIREVQTVQADADLAARLGCRVGQEWLHVTSWRYVGEREPPICWTEIYIDGAFREVAGDLLGNKTLIFDVLARRFGIALKEIAQRISAVSAPAPIARGLQVDAGAPSLLIERRYYGSQSTPVEVSFSIHPGERFHYEMKLVSMPGRRAAP